MGERVKRMPDDIKPRISDRVLFVAALGLFIVVIFVSGGFSAIHNVVKKQEAMGGSVQASCPPCEEAKREKEQAALDNKAKAVEDTAETENPDNGG
ncbi:MAG: hypothetical protein JKY27_13770 [Magnetovibrio sp.]|nr:hypothetical protein [Magnetovibrio sp.]